jgi:hydrogenase large subunit
LRDPEQIQEYVAHSWYKSAKEQFGPLHPFDGETSLDYSGPTPPFEHLDPDWAYSWVKAPRWRGKPMEVGPLARLALLHASGDAPAMALTAEMLTRLGVALRRHLFDAGAHPGARHRKQVAGRPHGRLARQFDGQYRGRRFEHFQQ